LITEFEWDEDNLHHVEVEDKVDADDVDAMIPNGSIAVRRNKRDASGDYIFEGTGRGGRPVTIVAARTAVAGVWRPVNAIYGS
jgi:hypothetical protein